MMGSDDTHWIRKQFDPEGMESERKISEGNERETTTITGDDNAVISGTRREDLCGIIWWFRRVSQIFVVPYPASVQNESSE